MPTHAHQPFTFLEQMHVESDNNRAERAIRPPCISYSSASYQYSHLSTGKPVR